MAGPGQARAEGKSIGAGNQIQDSIGSPVTLHFKSLERSEKSRLAHPPGIIFNGNQGEVIGRMPRRPIWSVNPSAIGDGDNKLPMAAVEERDGYCQTDLADCTFPDQGHCVYPVLTIIQG